MTGFRPAALAVLLLFAPGIDGKTIPCGHTASHFRDSCADGGLAPLQGPDVPNFPTPPASVFEMLRLAKVTKNDLVYDLGCGDGRIVVAAAKEFGASGVGVDIDPQCVRDSEANARKAGVVRRARFYRENLFKTDISKATVVALYLSPELNRRLVPKLLKELKPGSRVVAHVYDMGDWEPDKTVEAPGSKKYKLYLWTIPAQVGGSWRWTATTSAGMQSDAFNLTQRYQRLAGTLGYGGHALTVSSGFVHGDAISLVAEEKGQGGRTLTIQGTLRGNVLTGMLTVRELNRETTVAITARRDGA